MKLDAFGKRLEIVFENGGWTVYSLGEGKRSRETDIVIPADLPADRVPRFIADVLHEFSTPEKSDVQLID